MWFKFYVPWASEWFAGEVIDTLKDSYGNDVYHLDYRRGYPPMEVRVNEKSLVELSKKEYVKWKLRGGL